MKKTDLALLLFSFFVSAQGSFFGSTQSFGENLHVEEVEFASHGATLSGSIVFPVNQPIHAAVVFIHGSGSKRETWAWRSASPSKASWRWYMTSEELENPVANTKGSIASAKRMLHSWRTMRFQL